MKNDVIAYVLQLESGNFISKKEDTCNFYPAQSLTEAHIFFGKEVAEITSKNYTVWGQTKVVPIKISLMAN